MTIAAFPIGGDVRVNSTTSGTQTFPAVARAEGRRPRRDADIPNHQWRRRQRDLRPALRLARCPAGVVWSRPTRSRLGCIIQAVPSPCAHDRAAAVRA